MDAKGKERGILKLDSRPRIGIDTGRSELTPQGSCEQGPSSPQPSVDRLSVTWADPGSMTSSGVNLFHLPSDTPINNEVKFSPSAGEVSEDEDYSASLSAVLRQRRASVRRSRKGRARRPSSPFLPDDSRSRRRSSAFTTSSGDTAISIEEGQPTVVTQEEIFENIHLHKEVLGSVKQQPLGMRRKLKIVHQAKGYIKRHEGQLQERLAQSKSTRDIYARFNILLAAKWQQLKREAANTSNLLIPWELRIKEIESHFGSVVASYFTFLRWLFWVNLVIGFIFLVFVIIPECLTANPQQDGERKIIMEDERRNASNLLTLWEFDGVLKYSPIFYGYYSNLERPQYRMPLAYFLTGVVVYIYSFVATLKKMAENSRMSKLSEKEDECIFSWKLFTGWDFMIGNTETAHNRIASIILSFKEALLEEAEKKRDMRNWRIITLRVIVNISVVILLAVSAYAVVYVVSYSDDNSKARSWWRENETTIVVTVITTTFPVFFELLGFLEHYHPRKQLRLQLARIMLLNLLNLYSFIFALFNKIEGMSKDLDALQPKLNMNASIVSNSTLNWTASIAMTMPAICVEEQVHCSPCNFELIVRMTENEGKTLNFGSLTFPSSKYGDITSSYPVTKQMKGGDEEKKLVPENLVEKPEIETSTIEASTLDSISIGIKELEKLRKLTKTNISENMTNEFNTASSVEYYESTEKSETTTLNSVLLGIKELERLRNIMLVQAPVVLKEATTVIEETYNYTFYESTTDTSSPSVSSAITSDKSVINYETSTLDNSETVIDFQTRHAEDSTFTSETNNFNTDLTTNRHAYFTQSDLTRPETEIIETTTVAYFPTDIINENFQTTTNKQTEETDEELAITEEGAASTSGIIMVTSKSKLSNNTVEDIIGFDITSTSLSFETDLPSALPTISSVDTVTICPNVTFNCTINCNGENITQIFYMSNCKVINRVCYATRCKYIETINTINQNYTNITAVDIAYIGENNKKMYNLTIATKKKLLKLCWETMFGQELVKLTMMDLVFVLLGTLFMEFFRALFVRFMNRCWCWDLEKKFPEYGDFKIAENILHLINNQGMVWMGMFFSPGLVVLNVVKLMIMMYLRSWAVMTCNVPHEVVFRVSKSNNFYLALLLTMLFLCVLPVGYTIVWVKPSWHCGPFSEYNKIYQILTNNIYKILPKTLNFALEYMASPAIIIPLLVLLILIIYYLTSLTNSLREANNDLKIQLRRERTEERRKMFQLANTRRRAGSSAMENTPFARWKKALPSLPFSKSIDSDDRRNIGEVAAEPLKKAKKRGGIFAKIVGMALDKKSDVEAVSEINDVPPSPNNVDEETDTDFHETLPKEILKAKDITIIKPSNRKRSSVEFKTNGNGNKTKFCEKTMTGKQEKFGTDSENKTAIDKKMKTVSKKTINSTHSSVDLPERSKKEDKMISKKQISESSTQSKQSDSIGSVIPVIKISTTESDEELLEKLDKSKVHQNEGEKNTFEIHEIQSKTKKSSCDLKSLQRQNSVDSINEQKSAKEKKSDDGHKYQYSL